MKKIILFCIILLTQVACSTGLRTDEAIIFYPSFARINAQGNIEANIQAWVYEQEMRPGAKELFSRWLKSIRAS